MEPIDFYNKEWEKAKRSELRVRVADYFDSVINRIDIIVETRIAEGKDDKEKLDRVRAEMLDEIKRIEKVNLDSVDFKLDMKRLDGVVDQEAENELVFTEFCFLFEHSMATLYQEKFRQCKPSFLFGHLIVLDSYVRREKVQMFKDFASLRKIKESTKLLSRREDSLLVYKKEVIYCF